MRTERVEAFSDGVLAIVITIMVLELKVQHSTDIGSLKPYYSRFVLTCLYWENGNDPLGLFGIALFLIGVIYIIVAALMFL